MPKRSSIISALLVLLAGGLSVAAEPRPVQPGVTSSEVRIGQSADLSGSNASRVKGLNTGYRVFFDRLNRNGGIFGRKVRVISLDDAYNPKRTAENTRKLIQDEKVFLLFKYFGTPTIKAALPLIEAADIPLFAASSGAEFLRDPPLRNVFITKPGYFAEARAGVEFAVKKLGLKRIGVFQQNDTFGTEGRNGTHKALSDHQLAISGIGVYERDSLEIASALEALQAAKPEAVFLWGVSKPSAQFLRAAVKSGFKPVFIANATLVSGEFLQSVADLDLTIYITMGTPPVELRTLPVVRDFIRDAKASKVTPDSAGLEGYIDALLLSEALRRAGKNPTREGFRNAIEKQMRDLRIAGLSIHYGPKDHQALDDVHIARIRKGSVQPIEVIR